MAKKEELTGRELSVIHNLCTKYSYTQINEFGETVQCGPVYAHEEINCSMNREECKTCPWSKAVDKKRRTMKHHWITEIIEFLFNKKREEHLVSHIVLRG